MRQKTKKKVRRLREREREREMRERCRERERERENVSVDTWICQVDRHFKFCTHAYKSVKRIVNLQIEVEMVT